jgi:hypothetical protein
MTGPREIIEIELDPDTTALLAIQILTDPLPSPNERPEITAPTPRQLELIAKKFAAREYRFP